MFLILPLNLKSTRRDYETLSHSKAILPLKMRTAVENSWNVLAAGGSYQWEMIKLYYVQNMFGFIITDECSVKSES